MTDDKKQRDILAYIHAEHPTPAVLRSGSLDAQISFDTEGDVAPGAPPAKIRTSGLLPVWLFDSSTGDSSNMVGYQASVEQKKPSWTFFWLKPRAVTAEA